MKTEIFKTSNISANNFEQCVKCTICTVYCPVLEVEPKYSGPKQAGPDGERLRLMDPNYYDKTLKMCLNCKRCEVACPQGVRIGDIIQSARIKYGKEKPKFRDMILANTDIVGTMSSAMAPVVNATIKLKPVKKIMDATLKIDHRREFPKYSGQKFETWFKKNAQKDQDKFDNHVSYFHGCYVNYNYPQLGKDLVKIMNAVGYGVHLLEKEKCCGVALISNGLIKQAKKQATQNVKAFSKSINEENRPVVGSSSTCMFTIRDEYPHLLDIDNKKIKDNSSLMTRFLFKLVDSGKVKLAFRDDYKARTAFHTACHMEKMGWGIYSTSLLRMIPGLDFQMLPSQCCGIAGTYGFKKENYETSQAIGKSLFERIDDLKLDFVSGDCETCKWQIEMSTSTKVKNTISVLADALDVEETKRLNGVG